MSPRKCEYCGDLRCLPERDKILCDLCARFEELTEELTEDYEYEE